jgi:serine/threonine-protein kinase CLA4
MAYHQVTATSLTPSRPAPQAPTRRGTDSPTMYSGNGLQSVGYNSSFSFNTATSPSASSYASSYSGIGGSPNRITSDSSPFQNVQIVRSGTIHVKEDGFASWLWKAKWLVLKEQTLTIHKNEVSCLICLSHRSLDGCRSRVSCRSYRTI